MLTVGMTEVPAYVGEEYIERVGKSYWGMDHFRATMQGRRIHICAVARERDGGLDVYYDSSACSPLDQYSRKRGFKASLLRALAFAEHGTPRSPSFEGWRFTGKFFLPLLHGKALRDAARREIEKMESINLWRTEREI
jgi:hypothetical protein